MPLSRSSVLHYWSARYGPLPIIGSDPTHSRNSAGSWHDGQGIVQSAIVNTPRFEHGVIASERRPVMRVEPARTNLCPFSEQFGDASWTKNNCTVTTDETIAPSGAKTAERINVTATTGGEAYNSGGAATAGAKYTVSCYVKKANRQWCWVGDRGDASWHRAWVDLDTGTITNLENCTAHVVSVGDGWYRLEVMFTRTNATGLQPAVFPANGATSASASAGDTVYVWGMQLEQAPSASAYIATPSSSSTTRSTDSFYWNYASAPQALMAYWRFIERGTQLLGARGIEIAHTDSSNPRFFLDAAADTNGYRAAHATASATQVSQVSGNQPAIGDVVEVLGILFADGSVQCIQALNGSAAVAGAQSPANALGSAWAGTRLWMIGAESSFGAHDAAEVKIVKYADVVGATAQARMDELREFELTPGGDVIS